VKCKFKDKESRGVGLSQFRVKEGSSRGPMAKMLNDRMDERIPILEEEQMV
jgi:hypothetical protein